MPVLTTPESDPAEEIVEIPKTQNRVPLQVALVGNPNTGKTTVFNALTGFRARVGNYAGVTVERKDGPLKAEPSAAHIVDLPGTYSLAARSTDEMVTVEALLGLRSEDPRPDLVLLVADASNLERNLFLVSQVFECGLPCALILNMMDVAATAGITIDIAKLSERLRVPVFPVTASRQEGLDAVIELICSGKTPPVAVCPVDFPEEFRAAETTVHAAIPTGLVDSASILLARRALLESGGMAEKRLSLSVGDPFRVALEAARKELSAGGLRLVSLEATARYSWIRKALIGVVTRPSAKTQNFSDKLDGLLIHRVWGTAIFTLLMLLIFQAIFSWSQPAMDFIDGNVSALGDFVGSHMSDGPLKSFVVDGAFAGVGGVLVFLPQIIILFFFIGVLEDCGYIARAAFLMDRLLSRVGLSGRSFIPMLSSFACAVPGIMATRTIADRRDRLTTILIAPLMSCSARLPVYALMTAAFVPERNVLGFMSLRGIVFFAMYLVGIVVAIPVALILKRTLLKGPRPAFIMELPPYRMPGWRTILHRMIERANAFLKRAGTVILAISVLIWALSYYPRPAEIGERIDTQLEQQIAPLKAALAAIGSNGDSARAEELQKQIDDASAYADHERGAQYIQQSYLGRMGHVIEPAVRPLGWDWKIGMAAIASFPAREVVVSTLGIIYEVGSDTDETKPLEQKLREAKNPDGSLVFNLPVALSLMVFFALCAQCAATLVVIRREAGNWGWAAFAFAYMTILAYIAAFAVYQIARLFTS
ncbi:ferrous iron transport protein B [soil metagenome]